MTRILHCLLGGALGVAFAWTLLQPGSLLAAENQELSAEIRAMGRPVAGEELSLRVEVSWPGRPELYLPRSPEITLPRGAASRLAASRSRFDGQSTRWSQQVVVSLPDRPGPWTIGPAQVQVESPASGQEVIVAEPLRLGHTTPTARLIGQGIGNGTVLAFALLFLLRRYRSLATEAQARKDRPDHKLLNEARALTDNLEEPQQALRLLEVLVELRLALVDQAMENGHPDLPDLSELQELVDAHRFGGEEIPGARCQTFLDQFVAVLAENETEELN